MNQSRQTSRDIAWIAGLIAILALCTAINSFHLMHTEDRLRRLESRRPVQLYLEIKAPTRRQAEASARAVLPVLRGAEGMR